MTPRVEIEATLSMALHGSRCELPAEVAAELCRTWLAVQDAPVVDVVRCDLWDEDDDRMIAEADIPANLIGRRVRLVVEDER